MIVSDISLKLDALGYISVAESVGIPPTTFTQCARKLPEFAEMTQNDAITPLKVIQGHRF